MHTYTYTHTHTHTHASTHTVECYSALKSQEILAWSTTQAEDTGSSNIDNHKRTNSTIVHLVGSRVKTTKQQEARKLTKGGVELVGSCLLVGTELTKFGNKLIS